MATAVKPECEISRLVSPSKSRLVKEYKAGTIIGVAYSVKVDVVLEQAVMISRCLGGL